MSKRTDPHRPGAIVPADYEPLLAYNCATSQDGWPVPSYGINCELDGRATIDGVVVNGTHRDSGACCTIGAHRRASADGKAVFGNPGKCGSCGAAFVYGELWTHVPTGDLVHLGHDCAHKYGLMMDRSAAELANGRARAAVATQIAKAERAEERASFLASHPGLEAALKVDHRIITDVASRFEQFRSLSDKQVAMVLRIADEVLNPRAPAPEDVKVPGPLGKAEFRGEIVSAKLSFSEAYGNTWKITVKVPATAPAVGHWIAWGTAPAALLATVTTGRTVDGAALRGQQVAIRATLEAGRDEHFRFMKRPTLWDGSTPTKAKAPRKSTASKCPGHGDARHTKDDGSWWEKDAQGIPLCRVCERCREAKLKGYRPEILTGYTQADVCEEIES